MAIGPDPRDLAAKAALAKRYGERDAWGNRIGGDEEPDEGAYSLAKRLVAQDLVRQGKAPSVEAAMGAYEPLDRLDQMLGKNPLDREGELFARRQAASMAPMQPRDGVIPKQGPMSQAIDAAGLRQKRDANWDIATGNVERTHAPGMEPDADDKAGAPVVDFDADDEVKGLAGGDFTQKVGVPGARPAAPVTRLAEISPDVSGMRASTKAGAEALRHMAMRADPAYQAAVAARKANMALPPDQQVSLPVRTMLPGASESASRYAGDGQSSGKTLGDLLRQEVRATPEGLQRVHDYRDQQAAARQLITSRARDSADARRDRMGLNPLPSWMLEGGRGMRDLAGDRTNLERDRLTAATQGQTAALNAQVGLAKDELQFKRDQMNQGRDDARRQERMQAQAAWAAADRKASELEFVSPGSGDARKAREEANMLKQFHEGLQREAAGSVGQTFRDAGIGQQQAPVPGPLAPAAQPGPMTQAWSSATGYPASHAAAADAIENPANTKSEYERGLEYVDRVGLSNFMNSPASQNYLANKIGPRAWNDVKMFYNWKLTDEKDNMLPNQGGLLGAIATGARAVNPYLMGFPRWLSQLTN